MPKYRRTEDLFGLTILAGGEAGLTNDIDPFSLGLST